MHFISFVAAMVRYNYTFSTLDCFNENWQIYTFTEIAYYYVRSVGFGQRQLFKNFISIKCKRTVDCVGITESPINEKNLTEKISILKI